jgi:outer membrane receptor protein involved in Fe transport
MKKREWDKIGYVFIIMVINFLTGLAGTTGKLAGVVTDKNTDEPIVAANVYLEGTTLGAATDADGYYYIINIPPGTYTVVVEMIGYKKVSVENVRINVNLTTHLDFQLEQTTLEGQEIIVVAERPIVQKDLTSTVANISKEEINALPVDNFQQVVELQAGVVGGHFRGGRTGEVSYLIDGIPVNDPFNNGIGATVENGAIQQLEVISGTFNAEYGQAMSGVVNIVTREGGNKFEANAIAYKSFYFTPHDNIFPNLNHFSGNGIKNLEANISGPLPFFRKVKFFSLIRWYDDKGYLFGPHVYDISDDDPYFPSGDSSFVAQSWGKNLSINSKLTYYLTGSIKLSYSVLYNHDKNRYYNHSFRLVPDATKFHFRDNLNQNLQLNHTLSASSFYTLKFSYNYAGYKGYVFEDPMDPRYLYANNGLPRSNYTFRSGGLESDRYDRNTESYIFKPDYGQIVTINWLPFVFGKKSRGGIARKKL